MTDATQSQLDNIREEKRKKKRIDKNWKHPAVALLLMRSCQRECFERPPRIGFLSLIMILCYGNSLRGGRHLGKNH